nr:uncharacterized protein C2orf78-like [Microcebus murinus]
MEISLGMDTSLGLQTPTQTLGLLQTPEFSKSCRSRNIQIIESYCPTADSGDISIMALVQSPSDFLALPPASTQEQKDNKNLDEIKTKLSKALDAYQIPIENQDPLLLSLEFPDIYQLLACIDPLGQEVQPGSKTVSLGNNSLNLQDQGTIESEIESVSSSHTTTVVKDIRFLHLLNLLKDLDQSKGLTAIKAEDTRAIKVNQSEEKSSVTKTSSGQVRKNKRKASEPISGAPKAKIQPKNPECLIGEEVIIFSAVVKRSNSKPQKAASSRGSNTNSHRQERPKRTRENNSKKAEESKQSGNKVKVEDKPTIPKMKRKKNQLELSPQNFKKPQTCQGMHMPESLQVFHVLGKKSDKQTGLSFSWKLGNSSNFKYPQPSTTPSQKPWLDTQREGKGFEKTPVKAQKTGGSAGKECPSPSQYKLPPRGKVKLVPLPFPTLDKPPAQPVPQWPHSLASHRPTAANPAQPASTNLSRPIAVNLFQLAPANASSTGLGRPAWPISTNATRHSLTNPTQSSETQSASSKPVPNKTSPCTSPQQDPVSTALTKPKSPPKPQNQFLLQDFSC